jgi:hypothetical protein
MHSHESTVSFFLNSLSKYLARSTHYEALNSNFLWSLVTSSPLGPNIFLSILFSDTFNPYCLHPQCETVLNPHMYRQWHYWSAYFNIHLYLVDKRQKNRRYSKNLNLSYFLNVGGIGFLVLYPTFYMHHIFKKHISCLHNVILSYILTMLYKQTLSHHLLANKLFY